MSFQDQIKRIKTLAAEENVRLNPPLEKEFVDSLEKKHNVTLPEDYKTFVTSVASGCDLGPPFYGWIPLGSGRTLHDKYEKKAFIEYIYLNKEFPFREQWVWEDDEDFWESSEEEQAKRLESTKYGQIYLGTEGCARNLVLIVNGEEKGKIWDMTDVGIAPLEPSVSFLDWIENWLEAFDAEKMRSELTTNGE